MYKKLLILLILPISLLAQQVNTGKILIVVSSYGKDLGKTRPGFEFDEYSQAYLIFKQNGYIMDVASPKGGMVEADAYSKKKVYNKQIAEDSVAMGFLKNTKTTASISSNDYDAIYIVGGKGAMFDLPYDPALQDLILDMYQKNKVVAAVCHGPAAFVNIKTPEGAYLIENKEIVAYCNEEETMFSKKWPKEYPFQLEDKLKERKAKFLKNHAMLPMVHVSGNIVTGQNPFSTATLADKIIETLGKTPKQRSLYTDEASLNLVSKAVTGQWDWAKSELQKNTTAYDLELIAVYGYYRSINAADDLKTVKLTLEIMELVTFKYSNQKILLERANCYKKLGDRATAKKLLEEMLQKEPDSKEAKKLLSEL